MKAVSIQGGAYQGAAISNAIYERAFPHGTASLL